MKILVLGGGGREHALVWRLRRDPDVADVLCAPGNPGIAALGRCVPLDLTDPTAAVALASREQVDLTVVGPEAVLERGAADRFADAGRPLVGPVAKAAALECSKAYAKTFMARHGIPTARFVICRRLDEALEAVRGFTFNFPVVVKADGLAAGKGVIIADDRQTAEAAVHDAMSDRRFGDAGSTLVIEECLSGPEVSVFLLCDGVRAWPLGSAQDHKRLGDDDRGPNTGGMGAFAPSPLYTPALEADTMRRVVQPVLDGMRAEGTPYRGFLYVSLMLTADGPRVIEFNVRFGDPEAQVVMPLVDGHLARAFMASATGTLGDPALSIGADRTVGVVLASAGYPGALETGVPIAGLDAAARVPGALIFHAGTQLVDGRVATAGGRVLTVVGRGPTFASAMETAYAAAGCIEFRGMQYRRDIGRKARETEASHPNGA